VDVTTSQERSAPFGDEYVEEGGVPNATFSYRAGMNRRAFDYAGMFLKAPGAQEQAVIAHGKLCESAGRRRKEKQKREYENSGVIFSFKRLPGRGVSAFTPALHQARSLKESGSHAINKQNRFWELQSDPTASPRPGHNNLQKREKEDYSLLLDLFFIQLLHFAVRWV